MSETKVENGKITEYMGKRVFDFMRWRKLAAALSIAMVVASITALAMNGLQFGLDFTGGTQIEVAYEQAPNVESVRDQLDLAGFEGASAVRFGSDNEILIKLPPEVAEAQTQISARDEKASQTIGDKVVEVLRQNSDGAVELRRVEMVGPQVGEELRDDGGLGMLFALAVVMAYVALRFQYKFSFGAVTALAHDVIIVLGFFALFKLDFDLTVLAAVLAVIGYSLNDTIVVADRIRENFRKVRKASTEEIINISISQTLGRTFMTSFTTLLVLWALQFFGGELIHNFSLALIVGVVVGTYSSIYVAANVLMFLKITKEDMMPPVKEGAELEEMP
ncbi:protein translocase subunit SecF [Microbulbifer thermotolerans]|uniref:Protein-export membrane protein SecF n=1 Tax=Microbulbifer thermotolerans TaxID=252514 RepID=A0A143HMX4_MICTH|nr:protein translocase subunit SecF [Microbulbifer thermotolerans]AMX03043.1 preprotein translocase subunit SecF [Microbulbifer thermotolerans]MCX2779007.1 protein translocase subunit SecF [Microbulbifer thermotolerans]MCX2781482.1 protein translocase subunit SecF [Microbulbifer thermotolerans]MCX2795721.1 protein translocase subunit SecF [Microbulbifer thermotolerans]MCX2802037.1 protein translocase subunit SecF [Microbulbifer thermotolerans]